MRAGLDHPRAGSARGRDHGSAGALYLVERPTLDRIARENGRFEHAVQDTRTTLLEILRHVSNAAFAHDLRGQSDVLQCGRGTLVWNFRRRCAAARASTRSSLRNRRPAARSMLSTQLIGGAHRPESLVLRTSAGEQECAVLTILMCDRHGNPAGFFSLVSPLFASAVLETSSFEQIADPVSVA